MDSDGNVILTVQELSEYLKVPASTLYKLARAGSVPCAKVGKHWRFHKDAIDAWLAKQNPDAGDKARE